MVLLSHFIRNCVIIFVSTVLLPLSECWPISFNPPPCSAQGVITYRKAILIYSQMTVNQIADGIQDLANKVRFHYITFPTDNDTYHLYLQHSSQVKSNCIVKWDSVQLLAQSLCTNVHVQPEIFNRDGPICLHFFSGQLRQTINVNKWVAGNPY